MAEKNKTLTKTLLLHYQIQNKNGAAGMATRLWRHMLFIASPLFFWQLWALWTSVHCGPASPTHVHQK